MDKVLDGYEVGQIIIDLYSETGAEVLSEYTHSEIRIKTKEVVNRNINKVLSEYKKDPNKFSACKDLTDIVVLALTRTNDINKLKSFIRREIKVK